ncbi:replication initiation protein [Cetobacterium sp. SF1]|uniref:replication initiation protein n=1 Tax=Cetobacterium sp. SF1 TaxID=3417654 RepID=UPI003CF38A22
MGKIGFNRKLNRLPIYFEKEIFINAFGWILKEFNKWNKGLEIKERVITIKKQEIWSASTNRPYTKEEFNQFIAGLTVSKRYEIDKEKGYGISGSIFITQEVDENTLKIEIPSLFVPFLFYKHDIAIIDKAKKKEPLTVTELDYWDTELKHKKKEILLLEDAELKGISGKYAKRLYMLLKQFESTGYFVMEIEEFREVLEVPKAYTLATLNRDIIKKSKLELEKKNIYKFPEDTKGKGRRKIEKIEIYFSVFTNETKRKKKLELTLEEEKKGREILQSQGISFEILNEQKKKSPSIYIKTIKSILENK